MKNIFPFIFFVFALTNVNSQTWSTVGAGMPLNSGRIESMCVYNGELYVGGYFTNMAGLPVKSLARWNGTTWDSVPGMSSFGDLEIFDMAVYQNELVIVGNAIHKWNGTSWSNLGNWVNGRQWSTEVYNNELYISGDFDNAGGIPTRGVARWNGVTWDSVGGGGLNVNSNYVYSGGHYSTCNGELYLAGDFGSVNGISVSSIARWNGNFWNTVGGSSIWVLQSLQSICAYNNEIYVGGRMNFNSNSFYKAIARWNSVVWDTVGLSLNQTPRSMTVYNNELYAAGDFDSADCQPALGIARWNDTIWNSVGSGLDLFHINNDTIIWWPDTTLSTREHINAMCVYNNELYVGGTFMKIGGINANSIARWHDVGASVNELTQQNSSVYVFPNPTSTKATFQMGGLMGNKTLIIYDQLGRGIWRKESGENQIEFSAEGFAEGMYFYRVEQKDNIKAGGKFIVKY